MQLMKLWAENNAGGKVSTFSFSLPIVYIESE
jgi:hypothetical protein